jgi:nucleoside 2-deoxyribosyltransferase
MEKRFQVFVSSTYEDLREERAKVMQALLALDCFPAGMELFPAADEDSWSLIKSVIDDCDYYLVIIAGKYGSIGPDGKSYTQMEYEYAIEQNKPTIAFTHSNISDLHTSKLESTVKAKRKLADFVSLVQQKNRKAWSNSDELALVVTQGIQHLKRTRPAIGWVRSDLVPDESSLKEILRLKKENEDLKETLKNLNNSAPQGAQTLAQGNDEFLIRFVYAGYVEVPSFGISNMRKQGDYYSDYKATWNEIFSLIAPLMINEGSDEELISMLNSYVTNRTIKKVKALHPKETVDKIIKLTHDTYHTIIIQLRALGLITQSIKKRGTNDKENYWTLTPHGDRIMTQLRAIRREVTK